jgi:hypothetical protein
MTIEEKLKKYILENYKSLRNFVKTSGIDVPYSTIDGIFKRGIGCASIDNVFKICDALGISADALIDGQILPKNEPHKKEIDLRQAVSWMSNQYILTVDSVPLSKKEILLMDGYIDLTIELLRKNRDGDRGYLYMTNYPELDEHERERDF